MKRTELHRKTPMPRGTLQLARTAMPAQRKPLAYRSKKTADLYRTVRRPLVAALLEQQPICQRCNTAPAVDVHELKSRARGGSITDPANLVTLCRADHDWITTHPLEAAAEGWLLASWENAA